MAKQRGAMMDIDVQAQWNANGKSINVQSTTTFRGSSRNVRYALAYVLLEDRIQRSDWAQRNGYSGSNKYFPLDICWCSSSQSLMSNLVAPAQDVLDGLLNNFSVRDRGVKNANFAVLKGSNSPSILIELGFVTNYSDVSQFVNDYDQERAAKAIADAIRRHFMK